RRRASVSCTSSRSTRAHHAPCDRFSLVSSRGPSPPISTLFPYTTLFRSSNRFFINSTFICKLTNAINHLISPHEYYKPCTIVRGQVNWTILFFPKVSLVCD